MNLQHFLTNLKYYACKCFGIPYGTVDFRLPDSSTVQHKLALNGIFNLKPNINTKKDNQGLGDHAN